jgi:hypothetical protein
MNCFNEGKKGEAMSNRVLRIIEEVCKILDKFPVEDYPPELQERITTDLTNLKGDLEGGMNSLLAQEDKDIIDAVQHLLGLLRINVEDLADRK